jgi:small subunit ribosomal protein S20
MANSASARKRIRQTETKTRQNRQVSGRLKVARKEFRLLVEAGKLDEAGKLLPDVFSRADRAAKSGVIHKNAAGRIKGRAAAQLAAKE